MYALLIGPREADSPTPPAREGSPGAVVGTAGWPWGLSSSEVGTPITALWPGVTFYFTPMADFDSPTSPLSPLGSMIGLRSEADVESVNGSLSPGSARGDGVLIPRVRAAGIRPELKDCVRLCMFNTAEVSVDEAWSELRLMLPEGVFRQVVKLMRITNVSNNPRIDMWVRGDLASSLVRNLREMTRGRSPKVWEVLRQTSGSESHRSLAMSGWRFALWQSWRDRRVQAATTPKTTISFTAPHSGCRLASLNVNGFPSKRERVQEFLELERITVCALQETLVSARQFPIRATGFRVYKRGWQEGFRGQAVLVRDHLPSYEVPHDKERLEGYKYLLHVKIGSIPGLPGPTRALHFVGVYLPSGGSVRSQRSAGLLALQHLYDRILQSEAGAMVVAMGDFNYKPEGLLSRLRSMNNLGYHKPRGSALSRFPVRGAPSALDHMLVSPVARVFCVRPRVDRRWAMSDHRPLVSALRVHTPAESGTPSTKVRYCRRQLAKRSFELANDNRWLPLLNLQATSAESLSDLTDALCSTLRTVTTACGIRVDSGFKGRTYFPGRLKKMLNAFRKESEEMAKFLNANQRVGDIAQQRYLAARTAFRKALKEWRRGEQSKHYARIAEDFIVHDHKNVWSRLRSQTDTRDYGGVPMPVRNKAGVLCVDSASHLAAVKEHYQALAQDDPLGTSRDERYWDSVTLNYPRRESTLGSLNGTLLWKEAVVAIRSMNRDTAPGVDEIHVNLLKALVREESMRQAFGPDKADHPDMRNRATPVRRLPESPLTPMGKALWKVLTAVWETECIPEKWNHVIITNLFKKGDPELLANYRGLSLISVGLKILMVVMVHRLEKCFENGTLNVSQAQSGFRKREEAISQFKGGGGISPHGLQKSA